MAQHPVLGYLVWAVLFGALFAWEGLALSHLSGAVPTLSGTFRVIGVARVSGNFLESAVTGCGLLLGLSAPLFLAASWLAERRGRR